MVQKYSGFKNIWGFVHEDLFEKHSFIGKSRIPGWFPFLTLTDIKVINEKFKFLSYFVKERGKWTLLHKNQFLDVATFQVAISNTSYDFLWKQTEFFSNHMHIHSLKGSS